MIAEERCCFGSTHREHVGDAAATILHVQNLAAVASPAAFGTRQSDIGQELQVVSQLTGPPACSASSALSRVEAEVLRTEAAQLCFSRLGEDVTNLIEDFNPGGRVAARRSRERRLIDENRFGQGVASV